LTHFQLRNVDIFSWQSVPTFFRIVNNAGAIEPRGRILAYLKHSHIGGGHSFSVTSKSGGTRKHAGNRISMDFTTKQVRFHTISPRKHEKHVGFGYLMIRVFVSFFKYLENHGVVSFQPWLYLSLELHQDIDLFFGKTWPCKNQSRSGLKQAFIF
jgi:hypothetical protein